MPKAHQKHLLWSPSGLVRWGESVGPETARLVEAILAERPHTEQDYRSCLGILRLARKYGAELLEAAAIGRSGCGRGLTATSPRSPERARSGATSHRR